MSTRMKTADITFSDVSASNLMDADRDWFGTSDPFVFITWGTAQSLATEVVWDSENPSWVCEYSARMAAERELNIRVQVGDSDRTRADLIDEPGAIARTIASDASIVLAVVIGATRVDL